MSCSAPFSPVVQSRQIIKNGAHARTFWRSAENSDIFSEIPPWWKVLFSKVAWLKSILAALLKIASIREVFLHGFCKIVFFGKFTARYLWRSFFSKVEVSNLQVPTLIKMKCFTKIYRTNDESNLHCVKDNVCIWMPLRCRDFQIALTE